MIVLGFGTASILGRVGRPESLTALESAYELGIRYYDTARSYGWGEAESVLGQFLQNRARHECTIVSKCGITPVRRSLALSGAKKMARSIVRRLPAARDVVRRVASVPSVQPTRTYDIPALRASLDTSLRELRTNYIDVLLLHNFDAGAPIEDVLAWFKDEKRAGRIRRYGWSLEGDLMTGLSYLAEKEALDGSLVQVPLTDALLSLDDAFRHVAFSVHSVRRSGIGLRELVPALPPGTETIVIGMFSRQHQVANLADLSAAQDRLGR